MKIAIVDDEEWFREKIKNYVENIVPNSQILLYQSGNEFLRSRDEFELVFMDIEMPGIDGFQTIAEAKKINVDAKFIIITTHTELSRVGYKVEAFRYIDKLRLEHEIQESIESYLEIRKEKQSLPIRIEGHECSVTIGDILYFETEKRKVVMTIKKSNIICDMPINELYEKLKKYNFYMPFRSSIINFKYVSSFDKNTIIMMDGHSVNLSRRKIAEFKGKYFEYKFNNANM